MVLKRFNGTSYEDVILQTIPRESLPVSDATINNSNHLNDLNKVTYCMSERTVEFIKSNQDGADKQSVLELLGYNTFCYVATIRSNDSVSLDPTHTYRNVLESVEVIDIEKEYIVEVVSNLDNTDIKIYLPISINTPPYSIRRKILEVRRIVNN